MMVRLLLVAACLAALPACAPEVDTGRVLTTEFLLSGDALVRPVRSSEYAPGDDAAPPSNTFSGRLRLVTGERADHFLLLLDELGLVTPAAPGVDTLPAFDFEFVQHGELLIPMTTGPVVNEHRWWEWVFGTGRVWDDGNNAGWSRAGLPFALKERREDCIHNGLLTFAFRETGQVSGVAFQVTSQTCRYLQFDMSGLVAAEYVPRKVPGADAEIAAVMANRGSRIPTQPIAALGRTYPEIDAGAFGSVSEIAPSDMTVYGLLVDDTHYVSACATPYGPYPYCDELALPSYSTAKSFVAGFALMLLEAEYPGAAAAHIADLVPECADGWQDVTIEHALDMTTGHFESPDMHGDEDAAITSDFFLGDHREKIDTACRRFPRRADPGTQLTYHTWDTYLAGVAMTSFLRNREGPDADFFTDLLVEKLWKPLGLSRLAAETRRTYDEVGQPYAGFGLTLVRDDIARLARFIGPLDGRLGGRAVLDRRLFDAIKQRVPGDPGMVAELESIRYNNGFRSFDVSSYLGCNEPAWVVVLSGFGGIIVAVMPNDSAYYYFSDGNEHRYLAAVRESHRLRPMCQ
ncbi:MAG: serine hydrolase [Woeseiaceae bacterium]